MQWLWRSWVIVCDAGPTLNQNWADIKKTIVITNVVVVDSSFIYLFIRLYIDKYIQLTYKYATVSTIVYIKMSNTGDQHLN